MRLVRLASLAVLLLSVSGCHSAYMEATVRNATSDPISPVEVDYPSASFGTETLAPGATFTYRFKVQGDGPTKLLWTDLHHQDHTANGPALAEKDEGKLSVTITAGAPTWNLALTKGPAAR